LKLFVNVSFLTYLAHRINFHQWLEQLQELSNQTTHQWLEQGLECQKALLLLVPVLGNRSETK
jgi:hypothetical protein